MVVHTYSSMIITIVLLYLTNASNVCSKPLLRLNYGSRFSGANHRRMTTISYVLIGRLTNLDCRIFRLVAYFSYCESITDLLFGNIYLFQSESLHCLLSACKGRSFMTSLWTFTISPPSRPSDSTMDSQWLITCPAYTSTNVEFFNTCWLGHTKSIASPLTLKSH